MAKQLGLFPTEAPPEVDFDAERWLASRVPDHVRLGTSSWTFPGWSGLIYPPGTSERELRERGLELYVKNPLFTTVGIDRSYYTPLREADLSTYSAQLPAGFPCVMKVWNGITTRVDPRTHEPISTYLDPAAFEDFVLGPLTRAFAPHLGSLVFEFPPGRGTDPPPAREFVEKLERFLRALPRGYPYSIELRNRDYFTPMYLECLRAHGVAHVFNHWQAMPDIGAQLTRPGVMPASHVVCRALLSPGADYDALASAYAPFDRIVRVNHALRRDLHTLIDRAGALGKTVYVLFDNKAEGSSPLSVRGLAERWR